MKYLRSHLGLVFPIVAIGLLFILIFTVSRIGLLIWQSDRLIDAEAIGKVLLSGLRIDIVTVSYFSLIAILFLVLGSKQNYIGRLFLVLTRLWFVVWFTIIIYMEVATPAFIAEYDLRPNRLFLEYLIYPKEVFGMLWTGYKFELFIGFISIIIALYVSARFSQYLLNSTKYPRWYWRPVVAILVVFFCLLGARSTLGHRPINPSMVSFSTDSLVNDLILNSTYSVFYAAYQLGDDVSAITLYPSMTESEIVSVIQNDMDDDLEFIDDNKPTVSAHKASYQGSQKNIVILLLESHGAQFVKSLGGEQDLSPNIDKLYQEGWGFTQMYATGTRSVRGIEAVTTGFTPTPARSVVKLSKSQHDFFTIARLLAERKYQTQFIYGGESHFDNMKSFFLGNGFTDIKDFPTFNKPKFIATWGASDEDLYDKANEEFSKFIQQGKPFFSLVFSSSNHSPYEIPDNTIEIHNQPKYSRENAVKYADYALGKFIEKAKKSSYWDNTIFAVIADHDARAEGKSAIPVNHFHIPTVIFGGGIEAKIDDRLISQIDLAPTLLSLAGIDSINPMIGHDFTKNVPVKKQRALMQRQNVFGYMSADKQVMVIEPGKNIFSWKYSNKELIATHQDKALSNKALAYALFGSLAYKEDYYAILETYLHSKRPADSLK
jgi:phosphoglycerol transferase MdoB-like AlkP superfamily enzyme